MTDVDMGVVLADRRYELCIHNLAVTRGLDTTLGAIRDEITSGGELIDLDSLRDDTPAYVLRGYVADDDTAAVHYPDASYAYEAAQEYVDDGDWGEVNETKWITVRAWRQAYLIVDGELTAVQLEEEWHKIELEPDEPECSDAYAKHDWQSPLKLVGGLEENPGVWGHGGGVVVKEVCAHCGMYRITDTWAQDRTDGEQGLTSVQYVPADEESREWVAAQRLSVDE